MMIFVGTEYKGGRQFHVWLNDRATTEDLIEAISVHEKISSSSFIIQHPHIPILPNIKLIEQGLIDFSVVHLYLLEDLRLKEIKRKEELKKEYEERGRYLSKKDGKLKLRRRTRKALLFHKKQKQQEKRGNGFLPCFKEFEKVLTENNNNNNKHLDLISSSSSSMGFSKISISNLSSDSTNQHHKDGISEPLINTSRNQKSLLTSRPLKRRSSNYNHHKQHSFNLWKNGNSPLIPSTSTSTSSNKPLPATADSSISHTTRTISSTSSDYRHSQCSPSSPSSSYSSSTARVLLSSYAKNSGQYREITPTLPQYPSQLPSPRRPWEER
ncbi:uncharacterized protein L201_000669 [Kwoniella dendrophila CBS 6074]|uniref:Uncharacterized protein n=1 Tax=Kwoniella dendrophila CBS 6074 TaxID=1295534 RepID=A0AAX4JK67_9TREE